MDEVLKRRVIGAAVLIGAGVLIPVIVVKLAQPSVAPTGESVAVYEITSAGETRPLDSNKPEASPSRSTEKSTPKVTEPAPESKPKPKPAAKTSADRPPPRKSAPKPEALATAAQATGAEDKPPQAKPKPKPAAPAPKPKPVVKPQPKPEPEPKKAAPPAVTPQVKATTKAKPATPSAEAPYFVVQVGSFGDEGNAIKLMQTLSRDFPVFYREGEVNGKRLYRVRVGPFDSRESANIIGARLREKGLKTQTMSLP